MMMARVRQQDMFLWYPFSFPLLIQPLLSAVLFCRGLWPLSCHCDRGLVSSRLSRVSSSDRGAWIPPPAQRSVFQSLPSAAGHRYPLRCHQVVSLTIALCQQSPRVESERHVWTWGSTNKWLRRQWILSCGSYGYLLQVFCFPMLLLNTVWHLQTALSVTPHAFHTIMVIDSTAEPLGTEAHDHDTRSYQDNSFTQCSRLLRDGSIKSVNEHYESARCELWGTEGLVLFLAQIIW